MLTQVDLTLEKAAQTCAACGKQNVVDLKKLRLGSVMGEHQHPDLVVLPPCTCGAQETLIRTFDHHFQTETPSPHHLAVNALSEHLRGKGRVPEELKLHAAGDKRKAHGAAGASEHKQFTPESLASAHRSNA